MPHVGRVLRRAHAESSSEERQLTEEFYALYGQTRIMLVKEFEASGDDRGAAVARAQGFLNRLIFIFFVEDGGLSGKKDMFIDGVIDALGGAITRSTSRVWRYIVHELFEFYRTGCGDPYVFAFKGGLFDGQMGGAASFPDRRSGGFFDGLRQKPGRRSWEFREKVRGAVGAHADVNPVIKNLLALASYDFQSQIGVTILGHIFENSISDLEEMLGRRESRRKTEGIYYTPWYVTRYICRRTIIPYLSRSGRACDPHDLVAEYAGDLGELDERLDGIRILDPACGSGAFLIEAAQTLMEIHDEMRRRRESAGGSDGAGGSAADSVDGNTLNPSIYDARVRRIAAESLYGIDANPQSVEIARLSLFLLTASAGESLPDLSSHVVAADSISPAAGPDGARLDWEDMFAEVFSGGNPGFSVIVGNPPFVRQEAIRGPKAGMQLRVHPLSAPLNLPDGFEIPGSSDLSAYFYLHSLGRLRQGGRLGFISSDGWLRAGYGAALQRALLDNTAIDTMAVSDFKVFGDADVNTAVVVAERASPQRGHRIRLASAAGAGDFAGAGPPAPAGAPASVPQSGLEPGNWSALFAGAPVEAPFAEVSMAGAGTVRFGTKTGYKAFFVLTAAEAERQGVPRRYLRPCVTGRGGPLLEDADAYEFLLDVPDEKGVLERTADGRAVLEYIRRGEDMQVESTSGGERVLARLPDLPTLAARRPWYSLGLAGAPPPIFLSRIAGGRIKVYENGGTYRATNTHVSYAPNSAGRARAMSAYLASAWFALHMERNANPMGGGALSVEVHNFAAAPVPDMDALPERAVSALEDAWKSYCADADLPRLDRAVLAALGLGGGQADAVLAELDRLVRRRAGRRRGS